LFLGGVRGGERRNEGGKRVGQGERRGQKKDEEEGRRGRGTRFQSFGVEVLFFVPFFVFLEEELQLRW
jgi:hypothetical protein